MKNFREMTWRLVLGHLFFFFLGVIALTTVVVVVGSGREKLGDAIGVISLGMSYMITSIISFLWFLLEKRKEGNNPDTSQYQKQKELTVTH